MALNITESHHVNTLLDFVLGVRREGMSPVTAEQAQSAAEYLADRANRTLMAGLDSRRVREAWASSPAVAAAETHQSSQ